MSRRTVLLIVLSAPLAASSADHPASAGLRTEACRLTRVPDGPFSRGVHTTLLANFDAPDHNDAAYARVHTRDVGLASEPDAPGKFGSGVAISGEAGDVRFPGLDNYNPLCGTVEFWVRSRDAQVPIWTDGKEHWLLVLYPERGAASPRYGTAPYFIALRKTPENTLELKMMQQSIAHYAVAVTLRQKTGWTLSTPAHTLDPAAWHHVLVSLDWRGLRVHAAFPEAPTLDEFARAFSSDSVRGAREQLAAWAAGKPLAGLVGGSPAYGRTFEIGHAINYCEALLTDIENALVALGDIAPERIPRYSRGGENNWVYMEPERNYFAVAF